MNIPAEIFFEIFKYTKNTSDNFIIFCRQNHHHFFINETTITILKKLLLEKVITDKDTIKHIIETSINHNIFLKYDFDKLDDQYYDQSIAQKALRKNIYYLGAIIDKINIDESLIETLLINCSKHKMILYSINQFIKNNEISKLYLLILKYADEKLIKYLQNKIIQNDLKNFLNSLIDHSQLNYLKNITGLNEKYLFLLNENLLKYHLNSPIKLSILDLEYSIVNHKNKFFNWAYRKINKEFNLDNYVLSLCYTCFYSNNLVVLKKLLSINNKVNKEFFEMIKYRYPDFVDTFNISIDQELNNYLLTYDIYGGIYDYYNQYNYSVLDFTVLKMIMVNNEKKDVFNSYVKKQNKYMFNTEFIYRHFNEFIERSVIGYNRSSMPIELGIEYLLFENNIGKLQKLCEDACYWGNVEIMSTIFKVYLDKIDTKLCIQSAIRGNQYHLLNVMKLWLINLKIDDLFFAINFECKLTIIAHICSMLYNLISNDITKLLKSICQIIKSEYQMRIFIFLIKTFHKYIKNIDVELAKLLIATEKGDHKLSILKYYDVEIEKYDTFEIKIMVNEIYPDLASIIEEDKFDDFEKYKNGIIKNNLYLVNNLKRKNLVVNKNKYYYEYMEKDYSILYEKVDN